MTILLSGFASAFALFPVAHAERNVPRSSIAFRMHNNFMRAGNNLKKAYQGEAREQAAQAAEAGQAEQTRRH